MIRVNDEFNLLPELFAMSDDFVRVDYWEDHEVDIRACWDDAITKSNVLTVLINAEPDRQHAIEGMWDDVRKNETKQHISSVRSRQPTLAF